MRVSSSDKQFCLTRSAVKSSTIVIEFFANKTKLTVLYSIATKSLQKFQQKLKLPPLWLCQQLVSEAAPPTFGEILEHL